MLAEQCSGCGERAIFFTRYLLGTKCISEYFGRKKLILVRYLDRAEVGVYNYKSRILTQIPIFQLVSQEGAVIQAKSKPCYMKTPLQIFHIECSIDYFLCNVPANPT